MFNLRHAAAAPRVVIDDLLVEALGAGLFKVQATVSNHGYLPTNLSDVAIQKGVAQTVTLGVDGPEVVINPATVDLGHLAWRNERRFEWSPWGQQWSAVAKRAEWLVRGAAGGTVTVTASSQKGGTHRVTAQLP